MIEVIPAVLADNFKELSEGISRVANNSTIIQIDICDGNFVPSISWPYDEIHSGGNNLEAILAEEEGLPCWDRVNFEFDLMVRSAHKQFDFFMKLGPRRIVFHIEAEVEMDKDRKARPSDLQEFKEFLESIDMYTRDNLEIGVAIDTTTDIKILEPIIGSVDFVQCMGIAHDGFQGEPFDERALSQIASLRTKYRELIISVDGAVSEYTAPLLVRAGANRLVVGSLLSKGYDTGEIIKYLENLK